MKNKRELANWIFNKISKEGTFTPQTIHRYLNEFEEEKEKALTNEGQTYTKEEKLLMSGARQLAEGKLNREG